MENQRLILYLALAFVSLLLWSAWQRDYHEPPPAPVAEEAPLAPPALPGEAPGPTTAPDAIASPQAAGLPVGDTIKVVTDLLEVEISTIGGDIRRVNLLDYALTADDPTPFQLMSDSRDPIFVAQSGLQATEGEAPTHQAHFTATQSEYRLADGQDRLEVPLTWTNEQGVTVTKTYTFHRDSYLVDLEHKVDNQSDSPWEAFQYVQLRRSPDPGGRSMFFIYTYTGGVIYSEEDRYQKISFSDM